MQKKYLSFLLILFIELAYNRIMTKQEIYSYSVGIGDTYRSYLTKPVIEFELQETREIQVIGRCVALGWDKFDIVNMFTHIASTSTIFGIEGIEFIHRVMSKQINTNLYHRDIKIVKRLVRAQQYIIKSRNYNQLSLVQIVCLQRAIEASTDKELALSIRTIAEMLNQSKISISENLKKTKWLLSSNKAIYRYNIDIDLLEKEIKEAIKSELKALPNFPRGIGFWGGVFAHPAFSTYALGKSGITLINILNKNINNELSTTQILQLMNETITRATLLTKLKKIKDLNLISLNNNKYINSKKITRRELNLIAERYNLIDNQKNFNNRYDKERREYSISRDFYNLINY